MSNMSYVRFENTMHDLKDCVDHLEDDLSESEAAARAQLIELCREIIEITGNMLRIKDVE